MTYAEALTYIHSLERFGILPGLERVRFLCEALGRPQDKLRFVHIAGTNGKGSTATMLAECCAAAGQRTGLYTSPYVNEFRERLRVNGKMIPRADLCRWTERLRDIAETSPEPITEFECITALALAWFAEQGCDIVILEVGLGGRWDATNVIPAPLCCLIMKISLDHTQILGDTLAAIAREKCGIIKPGSVVVSSCEQPDEALAVIRETAAAQGCPLIVPPADHCELLRSGLAGSEAILAGLRVSIPLMGAHMCRNALSVVCAAREIGLPEDAIAAGIARTRIPARLEILSREPLILRDGGHNPDCATALTAALDECLPGQRFCAICGMMADKNVSEYLRILQPYVSRLIPCGMEHPRAMSATALTELARVVGYKNITPAASPKETLRMCAGLPVLICGSFYLEV